MVLAFGLTPKEFALSLMGKKGEPSSGARQMPSHWSLRRANVLSHSSVVATQTPHASGIGLAIKMRGDDAVVLTSIGEGSTSQGEWYEGVNWAAIHQLPVIFLVENNQYAISVPQPKQMAVSSVAVKAEGLGLEGISVNGLDVMETYRIVKEAVDKARRGGGPTVIEAKVNRMTPHSSDDDDRAYRAREEIEAMKAEDPLELFRARLTEENVLSTAIEDELQARAKALVEEAIKFAEQAPYPDVEDASYPVFVEDIRNA
jgi:2-oxoisovalerate dehydrogenase E1 component alpha subunit